MYVCVCGGGKEIVKLISLLHSEDILVLIWVTLFVNNASWQNCGTNGLWCSSVALSFLRSSLAEC